MVGGQIMDLAAENTEIPFDTLVKLHSLKTGAMITAAVRLGMLAAGEFDEEKQSALRAYAHYIGLAFQIVDDVLDQTGTEEDLGKDVGSDAEQGKVTFLHFFSAEEALEYAERLTESAKAAIAHFPGNEVLSAFADYLLKRKH